jgi:hypothetical protein
MKHKYKFGGFTQTEGLSNTTEAAAGAANALVDIFGKPNAYGRQSGVATGLKQGATLGAAGAKLGGPLGAAAGGALGMGIGLIGSIGAKKQENILDQKAAITAMRASQGQGLAAIQADPDSYDGSNNSQFFKYGGSMEPMGMGSAEIKGPSHEKGGVQLPNGAEVEGGETISKDYVFSKELGFAQQHKPIAKAIGKIEAKRATPVRKNTLHALQARESELALQQESVKQYLEL